MTASLFKKPNRAGLWLAAIFLCVSLASLLFLKGDSWAIPIVLTLPFSVAVDIAMNGISQHLTIAYPTRNAIELFLTVSVGVVEYYVIGVIYSRCVAKAHKDP